MSKVLDFETRLGAGKINATAMEAFNGIMNDVGKLPLPAFLNFLPLVLSKLQDSVGPQRGLIALDLANIDVSSYDDTYAVTFKAWSHLADKDVDLDHLPPYLKVVLRPSQESMRLLPKASSSSLLQAALDHRATCSPLVGQVDGNADELFVVLSALRFFAEQGVTLNMRSDLFTMDYSFQMNGWTAGESALIDVHIDWLEGFDYHRRLNEMIRQSASS